MASSNTVNVVIQLRKDTAANYELVKNTFIPADGEVCIVETSDGLKFKVGDGNLYYGSLPYVDTGSSSIISRGYYLNGKFYTDSTYTQELEKSLQKLYLDQNCADRMYTYSGTKFNPAVADATDSIPGVMKLFKTSGQNEDGTMTQKSITNGVKDIKFNVDQGDAECLILGLPW